MSKDFFDHANWFRDKFYGETMTDDELVNQFAVRGLEQRVAMLHQIDQYEEPGEITDLRKAAHRMGLKRRLNETHHLIRKAGR